MNISIKWLILFAICGFLQTVYAMSEGAYIGIEGGTTQNNNVARNVNIQSTNAATQITTVNGAVIRTSAGNVNPVPPIPELLITPSNTGFGGRVYGGYYFNQYLAAELGYVHYAPSVYKPYPNVYANGPVCGSSAVTTVTPCINPTIRENGFDLEAKGILPFKYVGIFGKLGLAALQVSLGGSLIPIDGANSANASKIYIRPLIGVGVEVDIYQRFQISVSYTQVLKGGGGFQQADFVSAGFSYHFVDTQCGQFLC